MINLIKRLLPRSFCDRYRLKFRDVNLEVKIFWGKLTRLFLRPPFPISENGSINLHLGCGSVNHPQFINVDLVPARHVHYVRSIDDLSPFKDNSVSLIYACHCLEHFPHNEISKVLSEWFRVLKKDGVLRLSVPDFDVLLDIYNKNRKDINLIMWFLMGRQNYRYNFHKVVFTKSSLSSLLRNAGFKEIRGWQPGSCELSSFNDWSARGVTICGRNYPISLNIEAIK